MKVATDEEIQAALTALWEAGRVDVELVAAAVTAPGVAALDANLLFRVLVAGCCDATVTITDGADAPAGPRVDAVVLVEHAMSCPAGDKLCAGRVPTGAGSVTFRATHTWSPANRTGE